jgi:hypothetical protein
MKEVFYAEQLRQRGKEWPARARKYLDQLFWHDGYAEVIEKIDTAVLVFVILKDTMPMSKGEKLNPKTSQKGCDFDFKLLERKGPGEESIG